MMFSQENGPSIYYHLDLVQEVEEGKVRWVAAHPELLGCMVVAPDPQVAVQRLAEAREDWLALAEKRGAEIPKGSENFTYTMMLAEGANKGDEKAAREALESLTSADQPEIYQF